MDTETIAYLVYLLLMMISGVTMGKCELGFNKWQYWVILACLIGCYICGYVRGGVIYG